MKVWFAKAKQADMVNSYPKSNALQKYIKKQRCPAKPEDILNTLNQLYSAPAAIDLPPMLNYHLLSEKLSGLAAVDIRIKGQGGRGLWRTIFTPISNCNDINKQSSIDNIIIEELITNYH